jgi:hypothetical protein
VTLPYQPLSAQASSAAKVSAVRFPARVTQNGAPSPSDAEASKLREALDRADGGYGAGGGDQ